MTEAKLNALAQTLQQALEQMQQLGPPPTTAVTLNLLRLEKRLLAIHLAVLKLQDPPRKKLMR